MSVFAIRTATADSHTAGRSWKVQALGIDAWAGLGKITFTVYSPLASQQYVHIQVFDTERLASIGSTPQSGLVQNLSDMSLPAGTLLHFAGESVAPGDFFVTLFVQD